MQKIFVVANNNSMEYLGEFQNKREAKIYWHQNDSMLKKMIRKKQVKFLTEQDLRNEIRAIVKSGTSGSWEITRIIGMAQLLRGIEDIHIKRRF